MPYRPNQQRPQGGQQGQQGRPQPRVQPRPRPRPFFGLPFFGSS
ncbi:hypothetical protein AAFP30_24200 [Gordonia sp. CPCC 205515]